MCAVDLYMFEEIRKRVAERLCDLLRLLIFMLASWHASEKQRNELGIHAEVSHFGSEGCSCGHRWLDFFLINSLSSHCLNSWPRLHWRSRLMRCFYFQADSFFNSQSLFIPGGSKQTTWSHCTSLYISLFCLMFCSWGVTWICWNS